MKKLDRIFDAVTSVVSVVSHVGFLFIMLITVCDIVLRKVTGNSILGVYEIVERAMVCAVFASFAYTQTEHAHIQITLLTGKYPKKVLYITTAFNSLLSAAAAAFVAYAALRQSGVAMASGYTTGVLLIPLYPFYWVVFAAMIVLCLAFLMDMLKNIVAIFDKHTSEALDDELKNQVDVGF